MTEDATSRPTLQDVLELLDQLRKSAAEFQRQIDAYFANAEGRDIIKSRFASFEARFVSLELRLTTVRPDPDWQDDELKYMMNELREIGDDFTEMGKEFLKALQEAPQRIN